jgi:hypothetical protein
MKMAMELAAAAAEGATGCPPNLCCNKTLKKYQRPNTPDDLMMLLRK